MKNEENEFRSYNRLKKILSSAALCAMITSNLAGAATYNVDTVAAKGIGDGLATADFNSIVDTLKGWVLDDNDTNDGADDTATFAGDICNGSGDCLSDAMNASAGGKFVDGTTAADAVFTGGNVGIGTDSPSLFNGEGLVIDGDTEAAALRFESNKNGMTTSEIFVDNTGINFQNLNSARNFLFTTGNVGIGTSTPNGLLHIAQVYDAGPNSPEDGSSLLIGNNAGLHLQIDNNEIHAMSDSATGGVLYINENGGNTLLNSISGNVGIGTTTPTGKLDVNGVFVLGDGSSAYKSVEIETVDAPLSGYNATTEFRSKTVPGSGVSKHAFHFKNKAPANAGATQADVIVDGDVKATAFIGDGSQLTGISGGKFVDGTTAADAVFTTGNVGIGTDDPQYKLTVNDGWADYSLGEGHSYGLGIHLPDSGTTGWARGMSVFDGVGENQMSIGFLGQLTDGVNTNGHIYFNSNMNSGEAPNQNPEMVISANGNVGIGTTTPAEKLDLSDVGDVALRIGSSAANSRSLRLKSVAGGNRVAFEVDANETMTLGANGNVGVGETTPISALHVKGGEALAMGYDRTMTLEGSHPVLQLKGTTNSRSSMISYDSAEPTESIKFWMGLSGDNLEGAAKMTIKGTGNVGIGTTMPTEKLHVDGKIKMNASTLGTCDATNIGSIAYEDDGTTGTFMGCARISATSFDWVNLQVFGQQ